MKSDDDFDAIVVGGGLAGMLAALDLRPLRTALVSYKRLGEMTSSAWAQGGIAAAVGHDDSPALHAADTVAAGAGLVERRVAARLAADGPRAIAELASLGVRFDRTDSEHYALGREAAHSRRRILRAGGDATGAELVRAVVAAVRDSPSIVALEGARALEVVCDFAGAARALDVRLASGEIRRVEASAIVLATGGIGGLYRYTTNPTASRGTGLAIAARAGARFSDLEFVQFHPTALDVASDPLPLLTEALRGEGARLVDATGARIMAGIDPALELAPRDIVARRVFATGSAGGRAFLDTRGLASDLEARFPTVFAACMRFGIDPRTTPLPVVAAAHYHMGGIAVDEHGRTNVPGLYACGEVAATGVHGANRLASNSLLESVVYPERIAADIRKHARAARRPALPPVPTYRPAELPSSHVDIEAIRASMYAHVGVERTQTGLAQAGAEFAALLRSAAGEDVRDAATVAALVTRAALERCESRGSHARLDFPGLSPRKRHSSATLADLALASPA